MPANKNAVIRYKFLDELLSDRHHHYSMSDIETKVNGMLEDLGYPTVGTRQLEKDLVFLMERPFSAPIERYRSNGRECIRYKRSDFSIFTPELSKEERSILYEMLNTAGQFNGLPNFSWVEKLKDAYDIDKHKKVLSFQNNPLLKNSNLLASLYECVANEQVIYVTYQRFSDVTPDEYKIHPYLLKQYNNRWYLVGLRPDENKIYTLPLDRMLRFSPLPEDIFIPWKGDIEEYFKNTIGITVYDNTEPVDVYFWISDSAYPYYATKPIHHSQNELSDEDANSFKEKFNLHSGKILNIKCTINYELIQELARSFSDIIILEPTELRNRFAEKVHEMWLNYNKS